MVQLCHSSKYELVEYHLGSEPVLYSEACALFTFSVVKECHSSDMFHIDTASWEDGAGSQENHEGEQVIVDSFRFLVRLLSRDSCPVVPFL